MTPIRYILIVVDSVMEWHPLPPDDDVAAAIRTYLANDWGIDCSADGHDDAWLVTLDMKDGQPVITAVEFVHLPDYDPYKHPATAQEDHRAHARTA